MKIADPGDDFYVDCEICMLCDAPRSEAPDLMDQDDDNCFFTRQPSTPEEVERACSAVAVSCVEGVRYRGSDKAILRRLYDLGSYSSCDIRLPLSELFEGVTSYRPTEHDWFTIPSPSRTERFLDWLRQKLTNI